MTNPKLSIIIPMYNEERYIARCLDSIKKQTYKNYEIILIDDGSTDNTIEIASRYDVKMIKQKRGGCGKARNEGSKLSQGDILIFVDADMYLDKDFLYNLIKPILEGKEIGTTHGTELVGNPENIRARTWSLNRIPNPPKRSGNFRAIIKNTFIECGGQDDEPFGYEDDMTKKIGTSLVVVEAICYHNNPENLKEVWGHQVWGGRSLVGKKGKLKEFLLQYKKYLLFFLFLFLLSIFFLSTKSVSIFDFLLFVFSFALLVLEIIAIKRAFKEKYILYLFSIPVLFIVRVSATVWGMIKYVVFRK